MKDGVGLALSGGGFRATLFHLGSLWRLNELRWLPRITEVTSVSGGSITAGVLGRRWKELAWNQGVATNYTDVIVKPLREYCSSTHDIGSILGGVVSPVRHPSELLAASYRKHLFKDATLQDLPKQGAGPRFTLYATSLQTGASVRFSQPYLADYRLDARVPEPRVPLAIAVAASSAFPPVYVPVTLKLDPNSWVRWEEPNEELGRRGAVLYDRVALREKMLLGDGGIYDNLGLERAWDYETVLVSDAGAPFGVLEDSLWLRFGQLKRTLRVLDILTEQTRALRKRMLLPDSGAPRRTAYWGIGSRIQSYELEAHGHAASLAKDSKVTADLASMRTRLNRFSEEEQCRLINWGYALADAAVRRWVEEAQPSARWPYENYALGGG